MRGITINFIATDKTLYISNFYFEILTHHSKILLKLYCAIFVELNSDFSLVTLFEPE